MGTFASFSGVWRRVGCAASRARAHACVARASRPAHARRREGFRGFWKGLMPNLWRVCPQSAVTFAVYEEVKRGLNTVGVL